MTGDGGVDKGRWDEEIANDGEHEDAALTTVGRAEFLHNAFAFSGR